MEDQMLTKMATLHPILEKKTGRCLWRASHCWTDSDRESLVLEISQYIDVTVQGKCKDQVQDGKPRLLLSVSLFVTLFLF